SVRAESVEPPAFDASTILVGYAPGTSDAAARGIEQAEGASRERVIGSGTRVLRVPDDQVLSRIAAFQHHPEVRYAEPDYLIHADLTPSDPSYANEWGLHNTGQAVNGTTGTANADIDAAPAWNVTTGSSSIVVGVVDTGVDYTHPDLVANMWS